jgi:hypothetical protein
MFSLEQATYAEQNLIGYHRPLIGNYECVFEPRNDAVDSHHTAESVYKRTPVFHD